MVEHAFAAVLGATFWLDTPQPFPALHSVHCCQRFTRRSCCDQSSAATNVSQCQTIQRACVYRRAIEASLCRSRNAQLESKRPAPGRCVRWMQSALCTTLACRSSAEAPWAWRAKVLWCVGSDFLLARPKRSLCSRSNHNLNPWSVSAVSIRRIALPFKQQEQQQLPALPVPQHPTPQQRSDVSCAAGGAVSQTLRVYESYTLNAQALHKLRIQTQEG